MKNTTPEFVQRTFSAFVTWVVAGWLTAISTTCESKDNSPVSQSDGRLPSVQEMIDARTDVWGDAAMRQTDGASYEFFKDLLPPLRWVNADFRYYPIVLSAPRAALKPRLVSNGSAVNALASKPPMWFEQGTPVKFYVGEPAEAFGENIEQLGTPTYLDGYLPVVTIRYKSGATNYLEEVFAPVDETSAAGGAAMDRFSVGTGGSSKGHVEARIDTKAKLRVDNRAVLDDKGQCLVAYSQNWRWDGERKSLAAEISAGQSAELAIYTKPIVSVPSMNSAAYDHRRTQCIEEWKKLLSRSIELVTPEAIVNDAWRATLIGNFMIAVGDRPNYSAGNAYNHLYEGECGDTLRSLMLFGHREVGPGMLKSMLEFNRKDTQYHVAGQKLQLLAYLYWLTRDAEMIRALEPQWRPSVDLILKNREKESGLLPKDRYAGDISTKVYSLNSNANCWRGLRDLSAVFQEIGYGDEAKRLTEIAVAYRKSILEAVERSERRDTKPPYIPIALLANEQAPEPLTSTELGSYYDLICPYIIGSEIFGQNSKREDWLLGYLQNQGGIAMGMMRTQRHRGENKGAAGMVPLYALRYNLALLRRDEREKAIVAFYGHLAQGMTRGTFIGGEGGRFVFRGDANGRDFTLPPNSTSNAVWLIMLRYLFVQDWDLDEDGEPDTLRLMYGVPRRWMADGKQVRIKNAPTAFGPVSMEVASKLDANYVEAHITPPPRAAKMMLLRVPLPTGWQADTVEIDGKAGSLKPGGAIELTGITKPVRIKIGVKAAVANR